MRLCGELFIVNEFYFLCSLCVLRIYVFQITFRRCRFFGLQSIFLPEELEVNSITLCMLDDISVIFFRIKKKTFFVKTILIFIFDFICASPYHQYTTINKTFRTSAVFFRVFSSESKLSTLYRNTENNNKNFCVNSFFVDRSD